MQFLRSWELTDTTTDPLPTSDKTAAAAITFTAPDSFGWAKGATLNLGALLNVDKGGQYNYYAGLTAPDPDQHAHGGWRN